MLVAKSAKSAVSLREAEVNSTLYEPAESATTSSLPKIAVSTSRSTAQPCCTKVGADAIKSLHQKLTEQKQENKKGCKAARRSSSLRDARHTLFCWQPGHTLRVSLARLLQKKMPSPWKRAERRGLVCRI